MLPNPFSFDVCVIGGGPAGIMAALSVRHHHPSASISLIDKSHELARKLCISGAGRGNVTNTHLKDSKAAVYHGDNTFIESVFAQFGYSDILNFFQSLGVPLYEETKTGRGKLFPVIENAKTLRDILVQELQNKSVSVFTDTSVSAISHRDNLWTITAYPQNFTADFIVLASGGKTYPALGSDGSCYPLAQTLGHHVILPVPSAVPLVSKNPLSHFLQGEKLFMNVTAYIHDEPKTSSQGDVLFTNYGFSGPAIFDCSHPISLRINRQQQTDTQIHLSFFPKMTRADIKTEITKRKITHPTYPVATMLWGLLNEKVAGAVCAVCAFPKEKQAEDLSDEDMETLTTVLTDYSAPIIGTRGWNEAEFTAGGIETKEIHPSSLESRLAPHLFFAGELLDVDGPVGGFNLSWAWASGWVAGKLGTL
jgi:predicted Rossmann fold flavoprotein